MNKIDTYIIPGLLLEPRYRIYRHLLLQVAILLITLNAFWDTPDKLILTPGRFLGWVCYFGVINATIYTNIYWLAPRFLVKNKLLYYMLSVSALTIVAIILIILLQLVFQESGAMTPQMNYWEMFLNMMSGIITVALIVAGGSAVLLFRYWMDYSRRVAELETTTLQSELKYLKNQINPHFLFNMLNNANVLIKKDGEEASQVLFKLEDLLRYQIGDSSKDKVLLSADIRFLNDYLNLEKIRRDKFEYILSKEGDINRVSLSPLLFIPFVENAVKHNSDSENTSYVHVSFKVWDDQLYFRCENSKPLIKSEKKAVGGLGLKNSKRRLELLYPGRHSLEITDTETTYVVNLHLTL